MKVRLEPIGEEIACGREETVLDAAFRQGYNLVYGCREGQCSACKCFLLEGEVTLRRYSNFALSDSEQESGYTLMCRAMPEEDLVVELLHYDPANYRLAHPIRDGRAVVETVEPLTHDITRLVLRAERFAFTPGQYVDLHVPGEDGARRSFSMANLPGEDRIELMIKRCLGGRLSGMLDGQIAPGDELGFTGPYGSFRLRAGEAAIVMIAGGSGMAPVLSLLRGLAAGRCARPVRFFYGARTDRDLFAMQEIERLGAALPDFGFVPVVERFVHEAVDEFLTAEAGFADAHVYLCGPPPMIDAASAMLTGRHGIDERRIFSDRFTTSADAMPGDAPAGPPAQRVAEPAAGGAGDSERQFSWFAPRRRRATIYEDVTVDTQPSVHRHLTRGWAVSFEDGRGTWDEGSTALRCGDWYAFRDPGEQWERTYYQRASAIETQIESAVRSAAQEGLLADFSPEWTAFLRGNLQIPAYVEHGLWFALATVGRDCLSDSVATCVCLQAAMKQRSAQALVLYAMDLERHHGPLPIADARERFLRDPAWQPTRRYLERLAATPDWGQVVVAANLCFEPRIGTLLRRELGTRAAAAHGDTVAPVLARAASQEWEWARAWTAELVRMVLADPDHGAANRAVIEAWLADWQPQAEEAAAALAASGPNRTIYLGGVDRLERYAADVLAEAGLTSATGTADPEQPHRRRRRPVAARPASAGATIEGAAGDDFVGIVMAKSAEGDAVAQILARRAGIEVLEQPAFWDIRARDRMSIAYAEVSDELGYAIDAYSIQHEMSTHYGRMVATDDALMLFSDPTEAMQYLMS